MRQTTNERPSLCKLISIGIFLVDGHRSTGTRASGQCKHQAPRILPIKLPEIILYASSPNLTELVNFNLLRFFVPLSFRFCFVRLVRKRPAKPVETDRNLLSSRSTHRQAKGRSFALPFGRLIDSDDHPLYISH